MSSQIRPKISILEQSPSNTSVVESQNIISCVFEEYGEIQYFSRMECLLTRGQTAEKIYYVKDGMVALSICETPDRCQISDFKSSNDIIGFSYGSTHNVSAIALNSVVALTVPTHFFLTVLAENQDFANKAMDSLLCDVRHAQNHSFMIGRCSAIQGIVRFLLILQDNSSVIELPMSRYDIADYLGLTIETVSRNFSKLKREKVVDFNNSDRVKILDQNKLVSLL